VSLLHIPLHSHIDTDILAALVARFGDAATEDLISTTVEDLSRQLRRVEDAYQGCAFEKLPEHLDRIVLLADQIGFVTVRQVAWDVEICARAGDDIALSATIMRLGRVCDCAIRTVLTEWAPLR